MVLDSVGWFWVWFGCLIWFVVFLWFWFGWVWLVWWFGWEKKERKREGGRVLDFCVTFVIYFIPWQNATDVSGKPSRPPLDGRHLSIRNWSRVGTERVPKQISGYLRFVALTGEEIQIPAFETLRDLRNAVIQFAAVVESLPPSKLRNETLAEAKAALGRICK